MTVSIDVLTVGRASYDLTYTVDAHPQPDEKLFASAFTGCGGGPAANGAVAVARLGGTAVFAGYLGDDPFGRLHREELRAEGVRTDWIVSGASPTPLSTIIAKPDGRRALIAYQADTPPLPAGSIDFAALQPAVILFDGHEPALSLPLAAWARARQIPTVLDAGSVHPGTTQLAGRVDYLLCSEKFARQQTGEDDPRAGLRRLGDLAPHIVVTLGARGLFWKVGDSTGELPAYPVKGVDTTGAGDTFHGAFAWCLARKMGWEESLAFASAAAALCCTRHGARPGIPRYAQVAQMVTP